MSYILTDAKIKSMAPQSKGFERADSILVQSNKIACIGSLRECRMAAKDMPEEIPMGGLALLPAFCDTHTHFVELAKTRIQLNLKGLTTIGQIREAASEYRRQNPILPAWIKGNGWDINQIDEPRLLCRKLLDELFPERPVSLFSADYHAKWCNSKALEISGLLHPPRKGFDSQQIRCDATGIATGLIYEDATMYMEQFEELPCAGLLQGILSRELESIFRMGLGSFHTMEGIQAAKAIQACNKLACQFNWVWHPPLDYLEEAIATGLKSYQRNDEILMGGVKIFLDGALGSKTAAMLEPYDDDLENRGILRHSEAELDRIIARAGMADIACTIHAIGDLSAHIAIKCFNKYKATSINKRLIQRIEHLQAISTPDLTMLKESGVYCGLQPLHLAQDIALIEKSWQGIRDRAYRWRDILDLGIPFSFGSDAPIEDINPFKGIYAAITRKPELDPDQASWMPEQRLDLDSALCAYTYSAAFASRTHLHTGSLEPGKQADIIAVYDWAGEQEEIWLHQKCFFNMVNGHINFIDI